MSVSPLLTAVDSTPVPIALVRINRSPGRAPWMVPAGIWIEAEAAPKSPAIGTVVRTCLDPAQQAEYRERGFLKWGLDCDGSDTWKENGLVSRMSRIAKDAVPEMIVMSDTCFCEYTEHGHCGVMHGHEVDNDQTLINLGKQAVAAARAAGAQHADPAPVRGAAVPRRLAADLFEADLLLVHRAVVGRRAPGQVILVAGNLVQR